jgi:hypothetical protein
MVVPFGPRAAFVSAAIAAVSSSALADFTNPYIPDWRGSAASEFYAWESFTSAFGGANATNYAGTESGPALFNFGMGAILTGTGNIYGGASPLSILAIGGLTHRVNTVFLNLSTLGTIVNLDTVRLTLADNAGHAWSGLFGSQVLRSDTPLPGGMGQAQTRTFKWELGPQGTEFVPTRFTVEFSSQTVNMSLDAVSLDFHYVPAPGALALLGFAGAMGSRRRRS